MKITYMDTLFIALPIKVETKNILNGTCRCPHVRPAKSKRGLGIEAAIATVTKAFRFTNLNNLNLALSIKL